MCGSPKSSIWGPEGTWLGDERYSGERQLAEPLGAVQMGLIYVNPEGPNGNPDPVAAARDIRETFFRMAMNDEETVALIAGGHTFGKTHGAGDPSLVGPEPEGGAHRGSGPRLEEQARHGHRRRRHHRRPGSHLDADADEVEQPLLREPVRVRMGADEEPGRREAVEGESGAEPTIPDAFDKSKKHVPTMLTTDLSLRFDPAYEKISRRFFEHPDQFADAFARAWFKLTHRDMGPIARYLGPLVPKETLIWQDPIPAVDHPLIDDAGRRCAEGEDSRFRPVGVRSWSRPPGRRPRRSAAPTSAAARTARAFASAPQKDWEVNKPAELAKVLQKLEAIQNEFNKSARAARRFRSPT